MSEILEIMMVVSFGASWPAAVLKSYRARTTKGKSLFFELFLLLGYAIGILRKVIQITALGSCGFIFYLSFFFYILNFIEISVDVALYFRNLRLDRAREAVTFA